jgi:hypothetical protein
MRPAQINWLNSAIIVAVYALSLRFPYQLLFFSYAFLGPAHYLTQISWMHDRNYFVQGKLLLPAFTLLTLCAVVIGEGAAVLSLIAALLAAIFFVARDNTATPWLLLGCLAIGFIAILSLPPVTLFLAALLPTILHVFVFTGIFLLLSIKKSEPVSARITFAIFALLGISFFFIPPDWLTEHFDPALFPAPYFNEVSLYLSRLTGGSANLAELSHIFAFLSFAYTYHYLNWFSKAEIIRWHHMPRKRLIAILAIYIGAIGIYLYDYALGFRVLLFLSLLHVLLEFPLNILSFSALRSPKQMA